MIGAIGMFFLVYSLLTRAPWWGFPVFVVLLVIACFSAG